LLSVPYNADAPGATVNKSAKQGRPNTVASGVDEGNEVEVVGVSRDALGDL